MLINSNTTAYTSTLELIFLYIILALTFVLSPASNTYFNRIHNPHVHMFKDSRTEFSAEFFSSTQTHSYIFTDEDAAADTTTVTAADAAMTATVIRTVVASFNNVYRSHTIPCIYQRH